MKTSVPLCRVYRTLSFSFLMGVSTVSLADFVDSGVTPNIQVSSGTNSTTSAIYALGAWMGFPMQTPPQIPVPPMARSLLVPDIDQITDSEYGAAASYYGQVPLVAGTGSESSLSLPDSTPYNSGTLSEAYDMMTVVTSTPYNVWSSYTTPNSSTISVIQGTDMPNSNAVGSSGSLTYPCNSIGCEIVYTLINLPDYTACTLANNSSNSFPYPTNSSNCPFYVYDYSVATNLLGMNQPTVPSGGNTVIYGSAFPAPGTFSSYIQNQMPNINANVVTGPLAYNGTQQGNVNNFIHTLTGAMVMSLPIPYSEYTTAYASVTSGVPSVANPAATALFQYILNLKSFGALLSIGLSDLEFIAARRMPNPLTNGTSAAFNESVMATRRLFNTTPTPGTVPSNAWLKDMQQASPIVLQREMLSLLAEINYQLYLSRMQDEKILMTLSAMQIGTISAMAPNVSQPLASLSMSNASSSSTTS